MTRVMRATAAERRSLRRRAGRGSATGGKPSATRSTYLGRCWRCPLRGGTLVSDILAVYLPKQLQPEHRNQQDLSLLPFSSVRLCLTQAQVAATFC